MLSIATNRVVAKAISTSIVVMGNALILIRPAKSGYGLGQTFRISGRPLNVGLFFAAKAGSARESLERHLNPRSGSETEHAVCVFWSRDLRTTNLLPVEFVPSAEPVVLMSSRRGTSPIVRDHSPPRLCLLSSHLNRYGTGLAVLIVVRCRHVLIGGTKASSGGILALLPRGSAVAQSCSICWRLSFIFEHAGRIFSATQRGY